MKSTITWGDSNLGSEFLLTRWLATSRIQLQRIKNDKSKRIGKIDLKGGGGRSLFDSSRA